VAATLDNIVVVGASLAGHSAAHALRREGYAGRLTILGAESRHPYQRPPLSKQLLAGDFTVERCALRIDAALDADWRLGREARCLDIRLREIELAGGERVPFDGLVIATGARPRRLRGLDDAGVYTLRTIEDCMAIREHLDRGVAHVAIVGAGFIGCEVAATLRKRDIGVTLIDIDDFPMQRVLGPALGAVALQLHRSHGVRCEMGVGVVAVGAIGHKKRITLTDQRAIDADLVLVGIGAEPAVEWLASSGIALQDGVLCDSTCAVAGVERIVAAGDVSRWNNPLFEMTMRTEHWDNAIAQGEAAARTLLAPDEAHAYASVPLFWSDQYDWKLQMLGAPRAGDDLHVVEGALDERRFVAAFLRQGRVVGAFLLNSMHRIVAYKRLIEERAGLDGLAPRLVGVSPR